LGARHVPAAQVALLLLTEVILAPFWVWLFVGETPTPTALIGGLIVLGAVMAQAVAGVLWERRAVAA
ncbi:MAG TPA: EamA family transporter, partial [Dongiaceae bacterium]|nr:EamA family transporter [Dongiaceae bacterium]